MRLFNLESILQGAYKLIKVEYALKTELKVVITDYLGSQYITLTTLKGSQHDILGTLKYLVIVTSEVGSRKVVI